jgi:hypothetical protein
MMPNRQRPGKTLSDNYARSEEAESMKYWELFFLTVGAGCFVGVIIQPASWLAVFAGTAIAWYGWTLHKKGGAK